MKSANLLLITVLCGCLMACNPDRMDTASDEARQQEIVETLAQRGRQFSEAYMQGDVRTMMSLYTDDAAIFPTNTDVIRDREAIEQYWTLPPGRTITLHRMTPIDVRVEGSMAYDFGYYEVSGANGEDAWGPTYGKYLVVWTQDEAGVWKMHLDMWNRRPAPEAEE